MLFDEANAEEQFNDFLIIMTDQLDWFKDYAAQYSPIKLEFKTSEYEDLEELFDKISADIGADQTKKLVTVFGRYLGEIVRRNYGGKWDVCLEKDNVYYCEPVIVDYTPIEGLIFSPISLMDIYRGKRKKGLLRQAIDADVDFHPLNLDDLPNEE